jgi:hypothetical protein
MSILDDAIREHLELKRAHGADESEIQKLEDEAFGPPGRPEEPDPVAEAPTEFLTAPGETPEAEESGGRRIDIADLQEPPPAEVAVEEEPLPVPAEDDVPHLPAEDTIQAAEPAEEEPSAAEHELIPEPSDAGPSTEERQAISEQPTEMFDVAAEMGAEEAPPAEAPSPSDEELAEAEAGEPKLTPADPPTGIHVSRAETPADDDVEDDDDFWSEQRLSDELDQALEAPLPEEDEEPPAAEAPRAEEQGIDSTTKQPSEEQPQPTPQAETDPQHPNYDPDTGHEDVLEDTPDFLEDAPEDDELWFEQRPPKDFDFDD